MSGYGTHGVSYLNSGFGRTVPVNELLEIKQAIAVIKGTTVDNISYLSTSITLTGQEWFYIESENSIYYYEGGLTGLPTTIGDDVNGVVTVTINGTDYDITMSSADIEAINANAAAIAANSAAIADTVSKTSTNTTNIATNTGDIAISAYKQKLIASDSLFSVYPDVADSYASVGGTYSTVPSGTTHLVINDGSSSFLVELNSSETGTISALDTSGLTATIGGVEVKLWRVSAVSNKKFLIVASDYSPYGDKGEYQIIYNSSMPTTLGVSQSYLLDNPLSGKRVECVVEIYAQGKWGNPGLFTATAGSSRFVSADYEVSTDQIRLTSGTQYLADAYTSGNSNSSFTTTVSTADVRIWVKEF